jgi:phage tail-like protein
MGLLQKSSSVSTPAAFSIAPLYSLEEYPIPIYQFSILFDDPENPVALFQTVSELSVKRAIESLTEGGLNDFGREFPGQISYGHITFGVGLSSSDFFYKWMLDGQYAGRAAGKNFTLIQRRPNPEGPDPIFAEVKRWNFTNAFPVSWKISELSLKDSENIVIESLELSFDYFDLAPSA